MSKWNINAECIVVLLGNHVARSCPLAVLSALGVATLAYAAMAAGPAHVAAVAQAPNSSAGTARVLHFPKDRSLGTLYVVAPPFEGPDPTLPVVRTQYLSEATGDVQVPAGQCILLVLNDRSGKSLSALSSLGPNDVQELRLAETTGEAGIRHLAHLTGLKELEFPRVTDERGKQPVFRDRALKQLAKLKSLERLKTPAGMTDTGLAVIIEALPQLKDLSFDRNEITDAGLALLPKLKALEKLYLTGGQFTNAGLAHLAELTSLNDFWLSDSTGRLSGRVNDDALLHIGKIPSLKKLKLVGNFTDACLAHLAGHPSIEDLDLHYIQVTDRGLVHLTSLPALKKLNLNLMSGDPKNPPITDAGLAQLKKIKTLERLSLPGVGITDAGLAHVAEMSGLKSLWAGGWSLSPLSNTGLKHLTKLASLESLSIGGTGITAEGISSIAELANLRLFMLFHADPEMSGEALAPLGQLKSLEGLYLQGIKNAPVSAVNKLNGLPRLKRLKVCGLAEDGPTLKIDQLPQLEYLSIECAQGFSFRDEDLACLANLAQLREIGIGGAITDGGLTHLAGLAELTGLTTGGRGVTDRGLAALTGMTKLTSLSIRGNFTNDGLRQLEGLKGITALRICSGTNLSPAVKERLRKNLPNLFILTVENDRSLAAQPDSVDADPQPASSHPKPGAPAPDFTVTTLDGKAFKLSEQRGKVVLLHFWATWCRPCVANLPSLKAAEDGFRKKYGDRLVMIKLAMDETDAKVRNLVESHEWSGPHACIGIRSSLAADYGVTGAPDDFLIGPDGRILLNRESPEGPGDTDRVIDKALKKP